MLVRTLWNAGPPWPGEADSPSGRLTPLTDRPADEPCGGAEDYTLYDPELRELTTRREAISAAWFATTGTFAEARNGRDGDDTTLSVTNTWTAAETTGEVWLAVVLRDERGGVGWTDVRLAVD